MYYTEGMEARVSPVQSIETHRILAPTRDSNPESPGPESRIVTTILPLHTNTTAAHLFNLNLKTFASKLKIFIHFFNQKIASHI